MPDDAIVSTIFDWLTTNTMIGTLIISTAPAVVAPVGELPVIAVIASLNVFLSSLHT